MTHSRTHSHMYYDEETDSHRLSLWCYHPDGVDAMHMTATLSDHDLEMLEKQIARARGQKATYQENPIAAQKED